MNAAGAVVLAGALAACGVADDGPVVATDRVVAVRVTGCSLVDHVAAGFDLGDGFVMTAAHTLRDATAVTADGRATHPLVIDPRTDVALLAVADAMPPVVIVPGAGVAGAATLLSPGATRPVTIERTVQVRIDEPRDGVTYERAGLLLGADVTAGESGSAVVDGAGRLAGMVFAASQRDGGPAYAVAASELPPLIEQARAATERVALAAC